MRGGADPAQLGALARRHRADALPAEVEGPVVTDERYQGGGGRPAEVGQASVVEGVPDGLGLHGRTGPAVAGDDGRHRAGVYVAADADAEHGAVAAQAAGELTVGGATRGLDVDEQLQGEPVAAVDPAVPGPYTAQQRVEVEGFEGAGRVQFGLVVGDEEPAVDEPDVRLDAAEAVPERVGERVRVLVVVVRVRAAERGSAASVVRRGGEGGGGEGAREGGRGGHDGRAAGVRGPGGRCHGASWVRGSWPVAAYVTESLSVSIGAELTTSQGRAKSYAR